MRKIHGRKAVTLSLAGAVTGGLILYGAVRLGLKLVAAPAVQRVAHLLRVIVEHSTGDARTPTAETVFQADPASTDEPGWTPPQAPNLYGPN